MGLNEQQIKQREAIERMKLLRFDQKIIEDFKWYRKLYKSVYGNILPLTDLEKRKVSLFEIKYDCRVYHVIQNYTSIGEMLSFLYVSKYIDEWKRDREDLKELCPIAYVVNLSDEFCSEFGCIGIKHGFDGLIRVS